jgi:hypothetical protein
MTTICITAPDLKTITRALSSDWCPTIHAAARRLGAVVALIYTLGFMAGERWRQLGAWAQEHQLHGLARLGLHRGNYPEFSDSSTAEESSVVPAMILGIDFAGPEGSATVQTIVLRRPGGNYSESLDGSAARVLPVLMVQRLAPALSPARQAANVAPLSIWHLASQGLSQREIAGTLGLTRYQVRKTLAA